MMLTEDQSDEWLNVDKYRYVVYYPNGIVRAYSDGCIFSVSKFGVTYWSTVVCGLVIVVEKSGDGKRIWLELA